jgi:hypothetical protein
MLPFARTFEEKGYLALDGLFDPALIDAIREDFERLYPDPAAESGGRRLFKRVGEKRFMVPLALDGPLLEPALYANPVLLGLLRLVLGEDFLIDSFTCVVALPGAESQKPHYDHPFLFPDRDGAAGNLPPYAVTVAIPLVDLDEVAGTTEMYGESDAEGGGYRPRTRRGGCYLMDYRLRHAGTPNRSDRPRPILYIVYARPWFTDSVNFRRWRRLAVPRDALGSVPAEHRRLFRRLAAPGAYDASEAELIGPPPPSPER